MLRMQDLGELGYGGVVTMAGWWDAKRIASGSLTVKDFYKKAGFWTYWGVGLLSTLASQFGWFRRYDTWFEHMSHGFIYDVPRQLFNLVQSQRTAPTMVSGDAASALREAQEIVNAARANGRMSNVSRDVKQDRYLETPNPAPIDTVPPSPVVTPQMVYGGRGMLG